MHRTISVIIDEVAMKREVKRYQCYHLLNQVLSNIRLYLLELHCITDRILRGNLECLSNKYRLLYSPLGGESLLAASMKGA